MSRLNFGRLMFFAGTMLALTYGLYVVMFSDTQTARYPLILIAGVVIALTGIVVLLFSRKEAVAEYKALEGQEVLKQSRRTEAEAKRMELGGWGDWEEFTQIRRIREGMIEFRNSTPFCMVVALGLFLAAFDMAFWGALLPYLGLPAGILTAAAGVGVFPIGRGTVIDGAKRKIIRWWGWVPKPAIRYELNRSTIEALTIDKKLGIKPGEQSVGRTVRYPLYLVRKKGWRILLKSCPSVKEARSLAKEISRLIDVPVHDNSGEDQTRAKKLLQKKPVPSVSSKQYLGSGDIERYVKQHIVEIAEGEFPDNTGLEWIIHGFERKGDLSYVEVEPVPPEVGYPRFKLAVNPGKSGGVDVVAIYCLEEGVYSLLSSASGFRRRLPKRLDIYERSTG